jgi:hypothetical protein
MIYDANIIYHGWEQCGPWSISAMRRSGTPHDLFETAR